MEKPVLLPPPLHIEYTGGKMELPALLHLRLPQWMDGAKDALHTLWRELIFSGEQSCIAFYKEEALAGEGYRLNVFEDGISIYAGGAAGAFYAAATLHQMVLQSDGALLCCIVRDTPGLLLRGALWDISRGKVPGLETLKGLADLLASLKYNHLELYMEGFSFGYPSFPEVWKEDACLLPEEVKELSDYCRARFIELTPHQNSLGHMAPWLALPQYRELAEAEGGLQVMGMKFPPTTLDICDPRSLALVKRLTNELLPSFDSKLFHAGLDEPFELGKGKNRELFEKNKGEARILSYIGELNGGLRAEGRRMMMWDDLTVKHPGLLERLPEDILIADWGYDGEYPVEKRARRLKEAGRAFCLCPGTSSWSSFTGLTDNMLTNISRTGKAAYAYGAEGVILADWGDMNHLQYQPVSYPGIAFAAAWAWNPAGITQEELAKALSRLIFRDASGQMGNISLEAGRFYRQEEFRMPCRSLSCLPLLFGRAGWKEYQSRTEQLAKSVTFFSPPEVSSAYLESYAHRKEADGRAMHEFLERCMAWLDGTRLLCGDGDLITREYKNALRMLDYLTQVRVEILTEDRAGSVKEPSGLLEEHESLWKARNKQSGLKNGIGMFDRLAVK